MLLQIALPVFLALATNGLIFGLGWVQPDRDIQPVWAPPGYVVGMVWVLLFGCMGLGHWFALQRQDIKGARLLTGLILLCLAYPFYTAGLQDRMAGLIGIMVTLAYSAALAWRFRRLACRAGLTLLPLIAWLCFAAALILKVDALNS
jgi:tryptophan-rich sensory protein